VLVSIDSTYSYYDSDTLANFISVSGVAITDPSRSVDIAGDDSEGDMNENPDDADDDGAEGNSLLGEGLRIKFKKLELSLLLLLLIVSWLSVDADATGADKKLNDIISSDDYISEYNNTTYQ